MNDQVTASTMPRAASARLARRVRFCIAVSTGLRASSPRSNGVIGTLSTPTMRTISSTMSALPCTSVRQEGIATFTTGPLPATMKPRWPRMRRISASGTSIPARRLTSLSGKSMMRSSPKALPTTTFSDGVPPQSSMTSFVASSSPGTMKAGSTPRSNR